MEKYDKADLIEALYSSGHRATSFSEDEMRRMREDAQAEKTSARLAWAMFGALLLATIFYSSIIFIALK